MTSQTQEEKERFERKNKKPEEDKSRFQQKLKEEIEEGIQKKL